MKRLDRNLPVLPVQAPQSQSRIVTEQDKRASTRTSRIIRAPPDVLYDAFVNPAVLITWLLPGEMTGKIHEFDARVGGGYRMSLLYPPDERTFRGKTPERENMMTVRFVELAPPHRIIEAINFVTADPTLLGEMTMTATVKEVSGGTEVALALESTVRPAGGG